MSLEKAKARLLSIRGQSHVSDSNGGAQYVGLWQPHQFERPPSTPLTEEQRGLEKELRDYVQTVRLTEGAYSTWETRYLEAPGCYTRFLRAEDWKLEKAQKRIKETLEWRREYKPDLIMPSEIQEEVVGGKIVVTGFTLSGMPVIYLRPARENTDPSPTQIRHMVFQLERAIDIMPEGVTQVAMCCDFKGASARSSPPMKITRSVVEILQNHYPERLGVALVTNLPWYLKSFFSAVSPFLDEKTRQKLKMNPDFSKLIAKDQLDAELGGEYHFEYKHDVYLPAICEFCGIADDGTRTGEVGPKEDYQEEPKGQHAGLVKPSETPGRDETTKADSSEASASSSFPSPPTKERKTVPKKRTRGSHRREKRPRHHHSWLCLGADAFDENTFAERKESRSEGRHTFSEGWHRMFSSERRRTSAVERNRKEANTEQVESPSEVQDVEAHFKRGEPYHHSSQSSSQPEIVLALEQAVAAEVADATTSPIALAHSSFLDPAHPVEQALELLKGEESNVVRVSELDHAQLVRPAALQRMPTLGENELQFSVRTLA